jgi:hypothetical protein
VDGQAVVDGDAILVFVRLRVTLVVNPDVAVQQDRER